MSDAARRAGRAYGRRRAARGDESDPHAPELDWPSWRRQVLAYGGIGPSKDWDREDIPGDLYREHGKPPDLVAAEAVRGAPWGSHGDDDAMIRQLKQAHREYEAHPERQHSIADPALAARRRALREQREGELRRHYGTIGKRASEAAAHNQRMADFVARARAARANASAQAGPRLLHRPPRRRAPDYLGASRRPGLCFVPWQVTTPPAELGEPTGPGGQRSIRRSAAGAELRSSSTAGRVAASPSGAPADGAP